MPIQTLRSLMANAGIDTERVFAKQFAFSTTTSSEEINNWYLRNGYRRLAGIDLDGTDHAFMLAAFFGGVKIISEDVARVPLPVLRRSPKNRDDVEEATDHPAYDLLKYEPNPYMTPMEFREAVTASAILGNAYVWIERKGRTPVALWPLEPSKVEVQENRFGAPEYIYTDGLTKKVYEYRDILHLKGFTRNGKMGERLLRYAQRALRIATAQEVYADDFFGNDRTPGIVLSTPEHLGPDVVLKIKEAFERNVARHGVAVLHSGLKPERWGQTNTDAQLTEQRLFELANVARFLRMPPGMLGDMSRMTFSNFEQVMLQYLSQTIAPWFERWEQAIWRSLLRDKSLLVKHTEHALLRADFKSQTDGFARLLEKGVYSINEVRALLNMNPIEGGDTHHIQLNMQAVQSAATLLDGIDTEPSQKLALVRKKG